MCLCVSVCVADRETPLFLSLPSPRVVPQLLPYDSAEEDDGDDALTAFSRRRSVHVACLLSHAVLACFEEGRGKRESERDCVCVTTLRSTVACECRSGKLRDAAVPASHTDKVVSRTV